MKPRLCIVGYSPVIDIARKVASEFRRKADFLFVNSLLEEALPKLRKIEGAADIFLAGPSTRRMYAGRLSIPIISFRPTFPDLIRVVDEARRIDQRIGLCLSREDKDFDIPLLSQVMEVSLASSYCDTSDEYRKACQNFKAKGYHVVIGASFTVGVAEELGIRGILLYKGMDMIRTAVRNAIEICQIQSEGVRRVSQLTAVLNNSAEGLLLTDELGRVTLDNPLAQTYLGTDRLLGKRVTSLFGSDLAKQVFKTGDMMMNVVERKTLVVNYVPVRSAGGIHSLVCTIKKVNEVQDAEFTVRRKLHGQGFVAKYSFDDIVGRSSALRACRERAVQFAGATGPILIAGESGTGKELFAHSIHRISPRAPFPFVALNCATLPSELIESELFGYEKGAFTGAHTSGKKGLIELAHKGTLFLDEVTSLNGILQTKLLRLLSEQEILKLGSDHIIPVDIRIIAATNDNIDACVKERAFREDLYYRLSTFRLHLPPLRERPEDLVPLFLHFIRHYRPDIAGAVAAEGRRLRKVLVAEPFRGNVREMQNVVRRFCLLFRPDLVGGEIASVLETCLDRGASHGPAPPSAAPADLKETMRTTEKAILQDLLGNHRNRADVCHILGLDRSSLWRKMKKYGLNG
jgi:transcriptional regulator with PAS, ATPase and Fis domain